MALMFTSNLQNKDGQYDDDNDNSADGYNAADD